MNKSWKKQREFRGDLGDMSKPRLAVSVDLFQEKINCKRSDGGIWFSFLTFWARLCQIFTYLILGQVKTSKYRQQKSVYQLYNFFSFFRNNCFHVVKC